MGPKNANLSSPFMLSLSSSSIPTYITLHFESSCHDLAPASLPFCPHHIPITLIYQVPDFRGWYYTSQTRGTGLCLVSALEQQRCGKGLPLSSATAASLGTLIHPEESSACLGI